MRARIAAALCLPALLVALPGAAQAAQISSHAQIHTCCMPAGQVDRVFAESKAMGAAYVRVDFELNAIFERVGAPLPAPDWTRVDHVLAMSRRYDLPVLGIVLGTPTWISACPEYPQPGLCGATDPAEYGRLAGRLAAHARGVVRHWEIGNEPDAAWAFRGSPEQYALMLSASHDAIKAQAPEDRIVLGGLMTPWQTAWLDRVLATAGADAVRKFDIAGVHLRGPVGGLTHNLTDWRKHLAARGFDGPVWVTEHGYSADPAHQTDPRYRGGAAQQAAYLRQSLPALERGGAEQVFVTLRDYGAPEYAAEGLASIAAGGEFAVRRRPAFEVVRRLAARPDQVSYAIAAIGF